MSNSKLSYLIRIVLWAILCAFITINIIALSLHRTSPTALLLPLLKTPFKAAAHVAVAKTLWDVGYHQIATRELTLAQDLVQSNVGLVLGATSDPSTLLSIWKEIPSKIKTSYDYWTQVTKEKPDYRDGFLMAGTYAYQMGKTTEALAFFRTAYTLDPNYTTTLEILSSLTK